jgi:hypothetical protein
MVERVSLYVNIKEPFFFSSFFFLESTFLKETANNQQPTTNKVRQKTLLAKERWIFPLQKRIE